MFAKYDADYLINHVKQSISSADNNISKLHADLLGIEGYSGHKGRHFLNNICSLPGCHYLEIGAWRGSTFIAALYANKSTIGSALAIDNWLLKTRIDFMQNVTKFLPGYNFALYEGDCFKMALAEQIKEKIDIYFYDGEHAVEDHYKAFSYYNPVFEDVFIAIVDDYNWSFVQDGTQQAFKDLKYKVLFEVFLSDGNASDPQASKFAPLGWWNGLYVAVVQKN